jgi:pSer/pThr/pTyr-binding forkhead associated (FHA) protein
MPAAPPPPAPKPPLVGPKREAAFAPTASALPAVTPPPVEPLAPAPSQPAMHAAGPGATPSAPSFPSAPAVSLASAPSPSVPALDNQRAAVRRCGSCGAELAEGFLFCGRCGARYDEEGVPVKTMYLGTAVPEVEARVLGRLVALRPDGSPGEVIPLHEGENVVGREVSAGFLSADRLVSPRHATFLFRGGRLLVRDEGSVNGVFLKLREERELRSGDMFRIGQELLRFDDVAANDIVIPAPAGEDTFVLGSPDHGYWGRLVQVVARNRMGNVFLLSGSEVTLGRERAQITFPFDGFVSATHAALLHRGERVFLVDRGSSNGTYVRLGGETPLAFGDIVLLGQNLLRVEVYA